MTELNKTAKTVKWLWLIFSSLIIVVGVFALIKPQAALATMAWIIGLLLLVSGICYIIFASAVRIIPGSGWILFDGIVTVLLSFFVFRNNTLTAGVIPYIFAMWIIYSGIQKCICAFEFRRLYVGGWGWQLACGALCVILGLITASNPLAGIVSTAAFVGWSLIIYGVSAVTLWYNVNSVIRQVKKKEIEI